MDSCEFWVSIGIAILGAILCSLGAYVIYIIQVKRERTKERDEEVRKAKEFLKYYKNLLDSAVSTVKIRVKCVDEYIKEQQKSYTELAVMKKVSSNDFLRIKKIDEVYLFNIWMTNNKSVGDKVVEYKEMNSILDFWEAAIDEIDQIYKTHNQKNLEILNHANGNTIKFVDRLTNLINVSIVKNSKLPHGSVEEKVYPIVEAHIRRSQEIMKGTPYYMKDTVKILFAPIEPLLEELPYNIQNLYKSIMSSLGEVEIQSKYVVNQLEKSVEEIKKHFSDFERYRDLLSEESIGADI
ncbi:hypothetical protein [Butyricimonas virosa]|jgi:hypothetical protein|uniref:hypothetical protein n=1 Tax=Butyricimonas virosa TaxID=544645 RepID=UPI0022E36B0C|nr:hypothetical protein [Butyricimonas virosa]